MTTRARLEGECGAENPDNDRLWSVELNGCVVDGTTLTHGDARKLLALVEAVGRVKRAREVVDVQEFTAASDAVFAAYEALTTDPEARNG